MCCLGVTPTQSSVAPSNAVPLPTDVIGDIGRNTNDNEEGEGSATPTKDNLSSNIVIPAIAMATGMVIMICLTIVAVLIYKWRYE